MKCEVCGEDFPSHYYFEVEFICNNCFKKMDEGEKKQYYETRSSKYAKDQASTHDVHGHPLKCPICGYDKFWIRKTLMNTPGVTFMGFDWANKQSDNYICNRCGYVYWFFRE
jgi:rubrerythrin